MLDERAGFRSDGSIIGSDYANNEFRCWLIRARRLVSNDWN